MDREVLASQLVQINAALDDKSDEGANPAAIDIFRGCYITHDYRAGDRRVGTVECGSARVEDTPRALYRLLYLCRPAEPIDFLRMHKSATLVHVVSPDYEFAASAQFYKYELALYFECARRHVRGKGRGVVSGAPGADNGTTCGSEVGRLWFETLVRCLHTEWDVYPGNNFRV